MVLRVVLRGLVVLALLGGLFGLGVWFGSLPYDPASGALPGVDLLAKDYDRFEGHEVDVGGRVVSTDPVVIVAEPDAGGELRLTVVDLDESVRVREGVDLRVYGVAEADHTVRALNAYTVSPIGLWYAWSVSFLAGLWVLGRIGRYWRVDWRTVTLVRRDTPLPWRAWLGAREAADA